jgi:predicted Zn-dependent protease
MYSRIAHFGLVVIPSLLLLSACSVNPATGQQQFTALMPAAQESQVGASEHEKIMQTFGQPKAGDPVPAYISRVGAKVAANTERSDVQYKFFLLDTPMVNAFALPGGYVYVSRGLLALANNEAELAGVMAHEIGHVTARHSAERYSQGVVTSLGAALISSAIGNDYASQALSVGSDLYIKSYSRGQEHQADELGVRYLSRAGYDPSAMASFLDAMGRNDDLESRLTGRGGQSEVNYFSTHPRTADRVAQASALASSYPHNPNARVEAASYLNAIDGIIYGDSPNQGFVRGQDFYHPAMGFTFRLPSGFNIDNQPEQVVAVSPQTGAVVLFDAAGNAQRLDMMTYLTRVWLKGEAAPDAERVSVNGMEAATASFAGTMKGQPVTIRLFAVAWSPDQIFRFQLAIPQGAGGAVVESLKRTTYSLRAMSAAERQSIKPYRLRVVTARAGDTVESLAVQMPFGAENVDRFRVLNGLKGNEAIQAGRSVKIVSDK